MPIKKWREVIDLDFPKVDKVTPRMIEAARRNCNMLGGNVRLATGRISTSKDLDERWKRACRPLSEGD